MNAGDLIGRKFPVLDRGFVTLVDAMGDDSAVVQAARVSYGKGTRSVSDDRTLIRYLMRHGHMTPFEMCEIKIHVRVPMDCWRQWVRHRTAHVNEYSTRYSEAIDAAQATLPDGWRLQAKDSKQGSGGPVEGWPEGFRKDQSLDFAYLPHETTPGRYLCERERMLHGHAREVYEERLRFGVAREQARKDLPLSTFTEVFWKCDLRNVLHFLALRTAPDAQAEIREYAGVIASEIVKPLFPLVWEAFLDYRLHSLTLSRLDVYAVQCIKGGGEGDTVLAETFPNARERDECRDKLRRLGLL
jgi:thymidylate synthase (FAD)